MNEPKGRDRDQALAALQARLWDQGRLDPAAPQAMPSLIERLVQEKSARIALLLGRIAEAEIDPATGPEARKAVSLGLTAYLELLGPPARDRDPLFLALLYLIAHFHEEKDAILARLRSNGWAHDDEDLTRLERVLSFQAAAGSDVVGHMRRLMAVPNAASAEQAWQRIVASVLATFGAEAADAVLRQEAGRSSVHPS
jgi:hypothetical protein